MVKQTLQQNIKQYEKLQRLRELKEKRIEREQKEQMISKKTSFIFTQIIFNEAQTIN